MNASLRLTHTHVVLSSVLEKPDREKDQNGPERREREREKTSANSKEKGKEISDSEDISVWVGYITDYGRGQCTVFGRRDAKYEEKKEMYCRN